jgi:hypothetical protein
MSTLAIGTEVTGVDEAVEQLARVDKAADQVAQKTTRRFSKTVQEIREEIEWTEAIEAAKKKLGRETEKVTTATAATGTAVRRTGASVQEMASRVAGAGAAVATLSGALGASTGNRAAGLVAAMANTVAQGAAMGATFGPQGAVVGGILGVIPLIAQLAGAHRDAGDAAREQREEVDRLRQSLLAQRLENDIQGALADPSMSGAILGSLPEDTIRQQRDIAMLQARQADRSLSTEQRRQRELGISEDSSAVPEIRQQLSAARERINLLDQELERRRALAAAADDQAGAQRRQQAVQAEADLADRERQQRRRAGGRQDPQSQADRDETYRLQAAYDAEQEIARQRNEVENRRLEDVARNQAEEIEAREELNRELQRLERERFEESQRLLQEQQEENKSAFNEAYAEFADGAVTSIDRVREAWLEANNALKLSGQQMMSSTRLMERTMVAVGNNIADTIGGTMTSAFEQALGAWLDGSESFVEAAENMVKGVIKALVMESIVQAVVEFARGLTSLAGQDYVAAPQHFMAAAAWAAVGGVAGSIGAGIGAFGGGGEKKDDGGGDARAMGAGSVREESAVQNVVINVFPGGFTTRGEVVGGVVQALDEAARTGYRLDSRLLRGT